MRTYWLSFASEQGFLGACVVDVTEEQAAQVLKDVPEIYDKEEGPWVVAAARVAHREGCNPGGEVAAWRFDDVKTGVDYPKNVLMSRADIERLESDYRRVVCGVKGGTQ